MPGTASEPRERLRRALARVMETFTEREASDRELNAWADLMERFADDLGDSPPEHVLWAYTGRGILAAHGVPAHGGITPPVAQSGDQLSAHIHFGARIGGGPQHVHGGDIAAAFDVVLGSFFGASQPPAVTKRLDVRFLAPVPSGSEGAFEARLTKSEGRHFHAEGVLSAGGRVCASAEGEFVRLKA